jgi:hypothetical protein
VPYVKAKIGRWWPAVQPFLKGHAQDGGEQRDVHFLNPEQATLWHFLDNVSLLPGKDVTLFGDKLIRTD